MLLALLAFVLTSCSTLSNLDAISDGTALNSANFEIVRTVEATASAIYVLGFAGGTTEHDAIKKLKESANLQPYQTLTNYSVTTSARSYFGLVVKKTTTATADVVQFK